MDHGMGRRERVAVATVAASRTEASGAQLLVAACYVVIGACGAWAIRSVVESRPAELLGAWLAVSVVVASLWALRPRRRCWPEGDLSELPRT